MALLQARPLPRMEGRAGAAFCIYWGEVSQDVDGPIEWCRPVPDDQAEILAARFPELPLRTEAAHRARPSELGIRVSFLASAPATKGRTPDCDFAVPVN